MKNADRPAYAQGFTGDQSSGMFAAMEKSIVYMGLTKREAFAMAAMQGILAKGHVLGAEALANTSVEYADALLKRLES